MNLYQLLTHIPHEQLQRLAEEFGLGFTPSKRNLVQAISSKYKDAVFVETLIEELPPDCAGLLRDLVLWVEPGSETFALPAALLHRWQDPATHESEWSEKGVPPVLERLASSGLLFLHDYKRSGQVVLPHDIRDQIRRYFVDLPKRAGIEDTRLKPRPAQAPQSVGIEAVFQLLCVFQHHHGRKTQKGSLHRKLYEYWMTRFPQESPTEQAFELALQYALHRRLVTEDDDHVRLAPDVHAWVEKPHALLQQDYWRYLLFEHVMQSESQPHVLATLAGLLGAYADNIIPLEALAKAVQTQAEALSLPVPGGGRIHDDLRFFEAAGLVQWAGEEEDVYIQLSTSAIPFQEQGEEAQAPTDETPESMACSLQNNFDLLIPPGFGYETLWRIDQIAELVHRDVMTHYHLTQDSVLKGLRNGWRQEQLFDFLNHITENRIPDSVRFTLEEWCSKYGRIRFQRGVVVVEFDTPELVDEILHVPEAREHVAKRISPQHLLIRETRYRSFFKLLRKRGYEPAMVHDSSDANVGDSLEAPACT